MLLAVGFFGAILSPFAQHPWLGQGQRRKSSIFQAVVPMLFEVQNAGTNYKPRKRAKLHSHIDDGASVVRDRRIRINPGPSPDGTS